MERGQQPTIEELLNKIIFLRKALEFYASKKSFACNNGGPSLIDTDRGYQASFALEQTEEIDKYNKNLIEEYRKAVEEVKEQEKGEQEALDMVIKVNKLMLDLGNKTE
jgi:hypothetical protein